MGRGFITGISMLIACGAWGVESPRAVDVVVAGQKCESNRNQIQCDYKIGRSLVVQIVGVGLPEVAITTYQTDDKGDYYASVGMLHGCVIIKPGDKSPSEGWQNLAFISPKNGRVYRDWRLCQSAS